MTSANLAELLVEIRALLNRNLAGDEAAIDRHMRRLTAAASLLAWLIARPLAEIPVPGVACLCPERIARSAGLWLSIPEERSFAFALHLLRAHARIQSRWRRVDPGWTRVRTVTHLPPIVAQELMRYLQGIGRRHPMKKARKRQKPRRVTASRTPRKLRISATSPRMRPRPQLGVPSPCFTQQSRGPPALAGASPAPTLARYFMSACLILSPSAPSPKTLADLLALIEQEMNSIRRGSDPKARRRLSELRLICNRLAEALDHLPAEVIQIDQIVDLDQRLMEHEMNCGHSLVYAKVSVWMKNNLLRYAYARGWSCRRYELLRSWIPVRSVLYGRGHGSIGIVGYAEDNNISREEFAECHVQQWKQQMFARKRLLTTIIKTEREFRTLLRRAGLQPLFPQFSLASRAPSRCTLPLEQMSKPLRAEIEHALEWKTASRSKGRRARGRLRPRSAEQLREIIHALCAFAVFRLRICGITSFRQVLTEEIVCGFIDDLTKERKLKPSGIITRIRYLHSLVTEYPIYKSLSDYKWLRRKLKSIRREPKSVLDQRRKDRIAAYSLIAEIPGRIEAERKQAENLDPVQLSWLVHHQLLIALLLCKPLRNRNILGLTLGNEDSATICKRVVPPRARRIMELPAAVRKALAKNPEKKLWVVHFAEDLTKGKREIWWYPDRLLPLLKEYVTIHRPRLIGLAPDPHSLFLNKTGRSLTRNKLALLVANLCAQYLEDIDHRLSPHDFRRVVSILFLSQGGTMDELRQILDHGFVQTTYGYCVAFDASCGVVELEKLHRRRLANAA